LKNLTRELLPLLESHRLDGLDAGPGAVYPFYAGYCLANLPASICYWLGIPTFGAQPLDRRLLDLWRQPFQNVMLLVVDGMGLNMLEEALCLAEVDSRFAVWDEIARRSLLEEAVLAPLTSLAPSTTSTALTTFWTGRFPAQHGVIGYEMWLKEYNLIANMIQHNPASFTSDAGNLWRAGFSPTAFLPVPLFGPHLAQHGVRPYAFQHHTIAHSGLSEMLFTGAEVFPFRSLSDLWVSINNLLDQESSQKNYLYVYWGDLDEHSHRFGPHDERVMLELATFSTQLGQFLRQRASRGRHDTLLLLTADHGHISTPRRAEYELRNHPRLADCLVMSPSGEARLPLVFLRCGYEAQFLDYVETTWPGQFRVFPSVQALDRGLFGHGEVYERTLERIGDYVVVPQGDAYWWFPDRENHLLGRHGGLSCTEMIVPLLSLVL